MPSLMRCPILENASRTSESEETFSSGKRTVLYIFFFLARGGNEEKGLSGQTGYFLSLSTSETAGVVV